MPRCLPALLFALPLLGQDSAAALERARQVNNERVAKRADFVVIESVQRYRSPRSDPPDWKLFDAIDSELAVVKGRVVRQNVRRNGKPWKKPNFSDFAWGDPYSDSLSPLFGPECRTTITPAGRQDRLLAYTYSSQADGCMGQLTTGGVFRKKRANPARTGRFLIDVPQGNLIQFVEEIAEFPRDFGADAWKTTVTFDYVTIAGVATLQPVSAEVYGGFVKGDRWRVTIQFTGHRRFDAVLESFEIDE